MKIHVCKSHIPAQKSSKPSGVTQQTDNIYYIPTGTFSTFEKTFTVTETSM